MLGCFVFFLALGLVFGPKFLDLTPILAFFVAIFGALLMGVRELIGFGFSRLLGQHTNEEAKFVNDAMDKITITTDLEVVAELVDKALRENQKLRAMDLRNKQAVNAIYGKILQDQGVMVGNPKLIRKVLRNR